MGIKQMGFQRNFRINRSWVEGLAMSMVMANEICHGARVFDVSIPENARRMGLPYHPGFDLVSKRPLENVRYIEVKGHYLKSNGINLTGNQWMSAESLRAFYWLYEVIDCGTSCPQLIEIQDPFRFRLQRGFDIRCLGYR